MKINESDEKFASEFYFLDNRKNYNRLLYVLAGYKPILWSIVFERLANFCPGNVDVCVISSGVYSEELNKICEKNEWSYISTECNKLTIAQNIAIQLHDKAEIIFKMDEDVFLTENFWELLEETYITNKSKFRIGFIGPLIPLHNYGFYRYLEICNLMNEWNEYAPHFVNHIRGGHNKNENPILYSDEIADFLWDQCEQIDVDANRIRMMGWPDEFVSMRYPICAILFERKLWKKLGAFEVGNGNGGGSDEVQILRFCVENSYFIICNPRSVCYHFGFAYQEHILYRKYRIFKEKFEICRKENL